MNKNDWFKKLLLINKIERKQERRQMDGENINFIFGQFNWKEIKDIQKEIFIQKSSELYRIYTSVYKTAICLEKKSFGKDALVFDSIESNK